MYFFDIDLTNVVPPQDVQPAPRKKGEVVLVTLASILNWIITGIVQIYTHNRGDGKISSTTAKSAASGLNSDIVGECTIGFQEIEGEPESRRQLRLNNWHSRAYGFLQRYINGELTKKDLATPISVRVQNDFLNGYQGMNCAGSAHKTKDMIKNPDLTYGGVLSEIIDSVGVECATCIGNNRWTVLSSILFELSLETSNWYWPEVYQKRQQARFVANERNGHLVWSEESKKTFVKAIQFWHALILNIESEGNQLNLRKIRSSAGFFGYVVCDRLSSSPAISKNLVVNSRKIMRNIEDVLMICPDLCRGNQITVVKYTGILDKILKPKNNRDAA